MTANYSTVLRRVRGGGTPASLLSTGSLDRAQPILPGLVPKLHINPLPIMAKRAIMPLSNSTRG